MHTGSASVHSSYQFLVGYLCIKTLESIEVVGKYRAFAYVDSVAPITSAKNKFHNGGPKTVPWKTVLAISNQLDLVQEI